MNSKNNIIVIIFCLFSFIVLSNWQKIHNYMENNKREIINKSIINTNNKYGIFSNIIKHNNILIKTDKFILKINPYGGTIEKVQLLDYLDKLHSKKFFTLLKKNSDFLYQIKSGIIQKSNLKKDQFFNKNIKFFSKSYNFKLKKNKNILKIPLFFLKKNILYIKIFTFIKGNYLIKINHQIFNQSKKPINIGIFGQIDKSSNTPKKYLDKTHNNISVNTFNNVAISTDNNKFKKYKFSNILKNKKININTHHGWIAILQKYFASVWIISDFSRKNNIYIKKISTNIISVGFKSSYYLIFPKKNHIFLSKLWIGPKIQEKMSKITPFLDLTVDYGFLGFLSKPLFKLLNLLFNIIGNWGFSIIIITIFIRIITYPLSKQQYIAIAKMNFLQPKIKKIKKNFNNDKERFSKEIILLYKKENLNPLSGFIPFIIQMPIFLALYYMLTNSIELRHAPFILWIKDLSSEDPYYILPIIMSITMLIIQKISQNNFDNDSIQEKLTYIIPIIFSLFFLWLPSGLVLYYIINNIITILQQKWIFYKINKKYY
ncbi:membrane protein insertase YidC [Enterobacteriaceae endosymbiont of Donacia thalassina]|uniref:membrane protein insertase YidC n=1 Tax=Enterobacteriaceae endosymbiont of Donacia thalassina TaxID=2675786 RepID=UPI0014492CA7|nr:membrane protein insertase YidC [Enterobacteriaceae endosymbiont of Donacia thalassina]QJC37517.1 membrane protein insertase YidC [Enterobacteriaceae endosymbiont of Donacia thalassina]